jgi:hypothetical protein
VKELYKVPNKLDDGVTIYICEEKSEKIINRTLNLSVRNCILGRFSGGDQMVLTIFLERIASFGRIECNSNDR